MGLLLKQLIDNINYVIGHINADEGRVRYDMGLDKPDVEGPAHTRPVAPKVALKPHVAPKAPYIPVTWEAVHAYKVKHAVPVHHTHVKHVLPVHHPVLKPPHY